jgi:hypothetical protein
MVRDLICEMKDELEVVERRNQLQKSNRSIGRVNTKRFSGERTTGAISDPTRVLNTCRKLCNRYFQHAFRRNRALGQYNP